MHHPELVVPFICACCLWCPVSWIWWAYWQAQLLEHIQKHHKQFDRTVLWRRDRNFWANMTNIYIFGLSKKDLGDERIAYLKSKLRPALIGFLGGQILATFYTVGLILAYRVFHII
jgi:hypothetical protein